MLGYSLPRGAADTLCKDVFDAEIKEAIWGQGNNKSSGLDGYNSYFFKRNWPIVGEDFLEAIMYCLDNSFMLYSFNATVVVLVPKISNPNMVKDFRPISCCSVIYKTVTRILVGRLSTVFPGMISMNQSAFVKGRSIVDNTIRAQEIVRGYVRKKISPRCALKIDLQKAFDSLNWEFVGVILYAVGLPEKFISWIWACFTNPSYSIVFNGSLVGILGVLVVEDKGSIDSIIGVQDVLDVFYSMSGLKLNTIKYEMYYVGISVEQSNVIKKITGFNMGNLPVRYMRVPLVTMKLAVKECQCLIDKLRAKLNLWANRHLSFAGRLKLIRSVLFSIANYWCRQLILPQAIISKVKQLCSRFFWKGSDLPAKGARVSWKKICLMKSEGRLGVQDVRGWNKSCIVHLIRKLLANEGSLCV
ncbi:uncharacterized protein LOC120155901 [Hibiscus syriacus]|uniref:uncharacterized protein LOC120155901 n=1 Tax=Hibiscus syriacus TaxID=106335 RepID=UPI001924E873|nr:uncharacterized protein LOC120155901 [Hibiscus syriacus]